MKRSITIYRSFEEQKEAERVFAAAQDPMERIAQTVRHIKAIYKYRPRVKRPNVFTIISK